MKSSKSSKGIPLKFLKDNADIVSEKLKAFLNRYIDQGIFPDNLKLADNIPNI